MDSKLFYHLIRVYTSSPWTDEHEKIFQMTNDRISEDTILAITSIEYPCHLQVDFSNVGARCILKQQFPDGKRILSVNWRIFDEPKQKMSMNHRELCGVVSALQPYEHYIV